MDISFIILTWNSEKFIDACLRSIFTGLQGTCYSYEIFIIDNGSTDQTPILLAAYAEKHKDIVKPIYLSENKGTTVSRNMGLRKALGKYLCIMDSDVELGPNLFQPLLEQLNNFPDAGMVVPKINYPSGRWQKSIDRFPTFTHKLNRFFRLREIEKQEEIAEKEQILIRLVDYAISAFWLFKRETLEKVGLLDEKIFYSPEDVDYCLRVWKAGFAILYVPTVSIIHHTQEISRGFKLNKAKISHIKGLFYYFIKHRYFLKSPVFRHHLS